MTPLVAATLVFIGVLGGALLGMLIRAYLPESEVSADSKDVVRVTMALTTLMTALLLGLVIASSKTAFDARDTAVKQSVVEILVLDRLLARYGPETKHIREEFRAKMEARARWIWSEDSGGNSEPPALTGGEEIDDQIQALSPKNDAQRAFQAKALQISNNLLRTRWFVFGLVGSSVQRPLLFVMVAWLIILFTSFGIFARRGTVVFVAFGLSAFSVASAIFLILELDTPFTGIIRISEAPMIQALSMIAK